MAEFTAEEAFNAGKRDVEIANEAVEWFDKHFGKITEAQAADVRFLVLTMRRESRVQPGELTAEHPKLDALADDDDGDGYRH